MAEPSNLIAAAKRAHPAFRFATAVAGLAAFVVVFARFGVNLGTIVFGTMVLLCLMTLFVAFVRIATLKRALNLPAVVILWLSIAVVGASVILLFTSAFFNVPLPLRDRLLLQQSSPVPAVSAIGPHRVRVALVAANWEYPTGQLKGPEHDMQLVAKASRKAGFRVRELRNATRSEFMEAWRDVETVGHGGQRLQAA